MLIAEILAALQNGKIRVNPKYSDRWFKLTGDVNSLEYGAIYIRAGIWGGECMDFSGRDWDGYSEDDLPVNRKYLVTDSSFDSRALYEGFPGFCSVIDASDQDDVETVTIGMGVIIDAYTAYGAGINDHRTDSSFKRLLGNCNINSAWVPSDYWIVIE